MKTKDFSHFCLFLLILFIFTGKSILIRFIPICYDKYEVKNKQTNKQSKQNTKIYVVPSLNSHVLHQKSERGFIMHTRDHKEPAISVTLNEVSYDYFDMDLRSGKIGLQ